MTEKLVRDWIPWIIRSQGRDCEWRVTDFKGESVDGSHPSNKVRGIV